MSLDLDRLPQHVAIIMDGNRRWAKAKGWNPIEGHKFVTNNVLEPLIERCGDLGIKYLTLWAFSTENWERDKAELEGMMKLFRFGLKSKAESLMRQGAKVQILGDLDRFPKDIAETCRELMEKTKDNTRITVTFALNYGGRDEIMRAFNRFLEENPDAKEITPEQFAQHLDTVGLPDPDLIIRPGGQFRLSGFLPWQSVYAELYFTPVLMPDFSAEELDKALEDFQSRQRRFGK